MVDDNSLFEESFVYHSYSNDESKFLITSNGNEVFRDEWLPQYI